MQDASRTGLPIASFGSGSEDLGLVTDLHPGVQKLRLPKVLVWGKGVVLG